MLTVKCCLLTLLVILFSSCYCKVEVKSDTALEDLAFYLDTLKKIVEGCSVHTHFTEPNYYFGLFLAKVNLKRALHDNSAKLDDAAFEFIETIIQDINDLLRFVQVSEETKMTAVERSIFSLLRNETAWVRGLRPLNTISFQRQDLGAMPDWETYENFVSNYEKGVPTPEQSDICLVSLAENSVDIEPNQNSIFTKCYIEKPCHEIIMNGTNFGYFLTHRLLLLLLAKFGRGCSVISPIEDPRLIKLFCSSARNEAQYNIRHGYHSADLVLEQMSLCGLFGLPTITRRDWLNNFLSQQGTSGCFDSRMDTRLDKQGLGRRRWFQNEKQNGDLHLSSVTASTLGTLVRLILEDY